MVHVVFLKIAAMFLVIVGGWLARRRGFLAADFTATLSRLAGFRSSTQRGTPGIRARQVLLRMDGRVLRKRAHDFQRSAPGDGRGREEPEFAAGELSRVPLTALQPGVHGFARAVAFAQPGATG